MAAIRSVLAPEVVEIIRVATQEVCDELFFSHDGQEFLAEIMRRHGWICTLTTERAKAMGRRVPKATPAKAPRRKGGW